MKKILVSELVALTGGRLIQGDPQWHMTDAVIDSRKANAETLFIPICGENNDGHDFIEKAFNMGCRITLSEKSTLTFPEKMAVILVDSTLDAMKKLAKFNRMRYNLPVIAVTGSSGKTTTKDLIAAVLSEKWQTMKTQGNFNNEYGIPQTLFTLEPFHEMAVVEMGMDHLGDIRKSIETVCPHIAVITNIGTAHIEILKSQDNILAAKKEIFETMGQKDIALLNGDDYYLSKIDQEKEKFSVVRFGINADNLDLKAENVVSSAEGVGFDVLGEHYHFAYPGIHNVYNCLAALWIAKTYGMTPEEIQRGFDAFKPSGNRMEVLTYGEITVINDSYNANPDSMKAALDALEASGANYKRKVAFLGDMLEMGDYAVAAHQEVGRYAAHKADMICGIGVDSAKLLTAAQKENPKVEVLSALTAAEAGEKLVGSLKPGDLVLLKASRGIHLERILEYIQKNR